LLIGLLVQPTYAATAAASPVMLANVYHSDIALGAY
jgi:hypothetical protein